MARGDELTKERIRKINELKSEGINPYPHKFEKKNSSLELQEEYKKLANEKFGKKAIIAGRLMGSRDLGKIIFAKIRDSTGDIQVVFQDSETPKKTMEFFKKYLDTGDFLGVEGKVFRTKRGELSILAEKIEILSKSIKTLPEKFQGLTDKEERYRKRYLDLIMNPEVREVFNKREKALDAIREFLKNKGFNEVETPYLQSIYGGAAAKPFKTHLNALNMDLFLAISPELYLKRLIVGGYEKVFTIARNFRNEGIDRWHNPEFTMMEIYQAYADYNDMMDLFENIFEYVAKKVNGSTKVMFRGKEVDFKSPWKRMTMSEAIKKYVKIDVEKMSEKEIFDFVEKNNVEVKGKTWGWAVQAIFEHFCEEKIEQPTFILDHPLEQRTAKLFETAIMKMLGVHDFVPVVFISALTKQRIYRVIDLATEVDEQQNRRIETSDLNDAILPEIERYPPKSSSPKEIKIRYATQVKTDPPMFAFFCNHPKLVQESYRRFLGNKLREKFGFTGVPFTIVFKQK